MFTIKKLILETDLAQGLGATYSIACISTSRPIYLIFDKESDCPVYAIRKIDSAHSLKSCELGGQLYSFAGKLVPEPLGIYEYVGEKFDVERGILRLPWFQLKAKIRTPAAITELEQRAWRTLPQIARAFFDNVSSAAVSANASFLRLNSRSSI